MFKKINLKLKPKTEIPIKKLHALLCLSLEFRTTSIGFL